MQHQLHYEEIKERKFRPLLKILSDSELCVLSELYQYQESQIKIIQHALFFDCG